MGKVGNVVKKIFNPIGTIVKTVFNRGKKAVKQAPQTIGNTIYDTAVQTGTDVIRNKISGTANKVAGVPTPTNLQKTTPMSGTQRGTEQLDYMNQAYPGTTPWERLGVQGNAGALGAGISAEAQKEMKEKELRTNERMQLRDLNLKRQINEKQIRAGLIGQGSPYGSQGVDVLLDKMYGINNGNYDTAIKVQRDQVEAILSKYDAETKRLGMQMLDDYMRAQKSGSETELNKIEKKYRGNKLLKEIRLMDYKNIFSIMGKSVNSIDDMFNYNREMHKANMRNKTKTSIGSERFRGRNPGFNKDWRKKYNKGKK